MSYMCKTFGEDFKSNAPSEMTRLNYVKGAVKAVTLGRVHSVAAHSFRVLVLALSHVPCRFHPVYLVFSYFTKTLSGLWPPSDPGVNDCVNVSACMMCRYVLAYHLGLIHTSHPGSCNGFWMKHKHMIWIYKDHGRWMDEWMRCFS